MTKTLAAADLRNLAAIAHAEKVMGGSVINGKVHSVPGHGDVVVQARAMLRLGALGLVTCEEHHEEITVYQGHCFGRLGGKRTYYRHTVFATLTDAGRAALVSVAA